MEETLINTAADAGTASSSSSNLFGGSSFINGASSIGSSVVNYFLNKKLAKEQREWNEQMMDKQNDWSLNMWNKTNEYNNPSNQLQRLLDAGLNPLYYGLDGTSANGLESSQPLGYERANVSNIDNPIAAGISATLAQAQLENMQADTAKKNNENLTETQRREKLIADIDVARQDIKNKIANEKLTDKQREMLDKELGWYDRTQQAIIAEKESSAKLNDASKKRIEELLEGEKLIQCKTIEDFEHKWSKIRAEISQIAKENSILDKDLENYAINHASNGFMGTGLSVQNFFRLLQGKQPKEENEITDSDKSQADAMNTIVSNKY